MEKAAIKKQQIQYQDILIHEFETRVKRNPAYSLRAYARDLGLSVSSLSRVLGGTQGMSAEKAAAIAKVLNLSESEANYFCSLVGATHSRSKKVREHAKLTLATSETQVTELSLEYFKIISDWHYYAIMELTGLKGFKNDAKWMSAQLGIPVKTVKESISRLLKLELIEEKNGTLQKTAQFRASPSGIPSRSIKTHHQQLLKKAETALYEQPVEDREFSNITFSMSKKDLNWARAEMKKFRRELTARLTASEDKDSLYQLSLHLFSLTQTPKTKSESSHEK